MYVYTIIVVCEFFIFSYLASYLLAKFLYTAIAIDSYVHTA